MKKEYISANMMAEILKKTDLEQQQLYMNLYEIYMLLAQNYNQDYNLKEPQKNSIDSISLDSIDNKIKLSELENKIYTVNGKVLTQRERIIVELKNIHRFINKNSNRIPSTTQAIVSSKLKELNSIIEKNELTDNEIIKYFKKSISILQAYLGIKIKFFNEAVEAFDELVLMSKIKDNTYIKKIKFNN